MPLIRFMSPRDPALDLPGAPATFVNGVVDIDDTETARLARLRYLGAPFGVVEMDGSVAPVGYLTAADVLNLIGAVFVYHGSNADYPRPDVPVKVVWFGTVEPENRSDVLDDGYIPVTEG